MKIIFYTGRHVKTMVTEAFRNATITLMPKTNTIW